MVFPLIFMSVVFSGTVKVPEAPTAAILWSLINRSPFSMTSSPFIVIILAPCNSKLPLAKSLEKATLTFNSLASKALGLSFLSSLSVAAKPSLVASFCSFLSDLSLESLPLFAASANFLAASFAFLSAASFSS